MKLETSKLPSLWISVQTCLEGIEMTKQVLAIAIAASVLFSPPVHAENKLGEIVGGIARELLEQEQDRAAFAQAQSQNSIAAYQAYLREFPKGAYAAQVREQVQRLEGKKAPPATEGSGSVSLSYQERVRVQRRLNDLGYSTSGIDGQFGPGTRRAIGLWQRDRNYTQTGSLAASQAGELLRGTSDSTTSSHTTGTSNAPAQAEAALKLSRQQRGAVQVGLKRRGFDTRGVDGIFGKRTRSAIAAWQRANDLDTTGYLTAEQAQKLMSQ